MAAEDSNDHGWPHCDEKRRILDVFNTDYGTKLFVEDGLLVEEKIQCDSPAVHYPQDYTPDSSSDSAGDSVGTVRPLGFLPGLCYDKPTWADKKRVEGQSQTINSAKQALEYYNTRHDTHYVLVNPNNSNAFIRCGKIWIHSSFTAAKAETCQEAELFFAEVMINGREGDSAKYVTTACCVLDDKAIDHCEICEESFPHPKSKFRQGSYKVISRALRPRSNGKVLKKRALNSWGY